MIQLVILVCLANAPADCRPEKMPFDGPIAACALAGQFVAAAWIADHPKWRVRQIICRTAEEPA